VATYVDKILKGAKPTESGQGDQVIVASRMENARIELNSPEFSYNIVPAKRLSVFRPWN